MSFYLFSIACNTRVKIEFPCISQMISGREHNFTHICYQRSMDCDLLMGCPCSFTPWLKVELSKMMLKTQQCIELMLYIHLYFFLVTYLGT